MNLPSSHGSLIRYYCTAGNGMERFLVDEVKIKLEAEDVCQLPGKVLFSSSARINRIIELKAAERLFLLLKQDSPVQLSAYTNPAKAAAVLQSKLLGDGSRWTSALRTWNRLQGELSDTVHTARKKVEKRQSEEQNKEEEMSDVKATKSTEGHREKEDENERLNSNELNGAQTLDKKRRREKEEEERCEVLWCLERNKQGELTKERKRTRADDDEEEERRDDSQDCSKKNVETLRTKTRELRKDAEEEFGKNGKNVERDFFGKEDAISRLHHSMESSCKNTGDVAKDFTVENVKTTEARDNPTFCMVKSEAASHQVSFRISCKCTGSLSRYFSTQEVSRIIGVGLNRLLGWKVDLKNPEMEIHVYLSDDYCLLGIPLTRLPLANRSYIKTTGLRSTVAWAMISSADIQPGFCVIDPMCGVGTILIEASQEHKAAHFLGVDNDDGQLQKANENICFAELENRIHLLKASSMALPLPSATVDAVVCDLPFGRKFGTKTNMAANLPLILTEMERVLRPGGSMVLLLSPQLSCHLKKILAQKETGQSPNKETKPSIGIHDCLSRFPSSTRNKTFQIHQGLNSLPIQESEPQSGLRHSLPPCLSFLKHQATYRVSLGVIDGLIHKYVKLDT